MKEQIAIGRNVNKEILFLTFLFVVQDRLCENFLILFFLYLKFTLSDNGLQSNFFLIIRNLQSRRKKFQ